MLILSPELFPSEILLPQGDAHIIVPIVLITPTTKFIRDLASALEGVVLIML